MLLLAFDGVSVSREIEGLLTEGPPGGVLILDRNVTSASQIRGLVEDLQLVATSHGSGLGLFIAVDQEGGQVQRIREGVVRLPAARWLGNAATPAEAARLAKETAAGLMGLGINMNLAPVADVVSDRSSFLYQRTYGGETGLVSEFVAAVVGAYSRAGLISVVKHFPGHGSAAGDSHDLVPVANINRDEFETVHVPPFRAALQAGAEAVMLSHIIAAAYDPVRPASSSPVIIGGLLREEMRFTGVTVSDDIEMTAAATSEATTRDAALPSVSPSGAAAVAALAAGCDLIISTAALADQRRIIDAVVWAAETGALPQARLDDAVVRILDLKLRRGIVHHLSSQ